MLLTLFGMSVLIFVLLRIVPGNISDILFDSAGIVNPADKKKLETELGLDQPLVVQYLQWIGGLLQRRPGLRLRLGEAGAGRDPAAHPDHRQARRAGAVLLRRARRAARRHQRGPPEHPARLRPAGHQPERTVAALVLARPADPHGLRAVPRLDPDLHRPGRRASGTSWRCSASRRPRSASAPRR